MSKGGRLSKLLPKFFRSGSKDKGVKASGSPTDSKGPCCFIIFLDDTEQRVSFKNNWKGQTLMDVVCDMIGLLEKDYFGLRYVDNMGQAQWVDASKGLSSQLKGCSVPHKFYFCVKFYAADPCKLKEEITRYMFFLQVKRDILQGRLPVTFEEAAELCAYAVQSELGDFDPRSHTTGYVSEFCFVPNQTEELEARIGAIHRRCVGATPLMAEHRFLEKVKWLDMYGVDLHPVQGESSVEYFLGLTPTGVVVYKRKTKVASYFWPRVTKATYKGKIYIIKVKDKNNEEHTYAFELSTKAACKHLWKCCVEHHAFFRLSQAMDREARPTKVLRSLSNASSRGRSERLAASYDQRSSNQQPRVQRVQSRRQPRRVNSDSRLNADQMYREPYLRPDQGMITLMGHPEPVRAPRHRSLPELQGRESPRSVKSAPWESKFDYGLYTSGRDSPTSGPSERYDHSRHPRPLSGSDSESGISQRKKYFPSRKISDNESDISATRRRRREIDSDSDSDVSLTNTGQIGKKRNMRSPKDHNKNDVHLLYPFHDKENRQNGSIPSLHSAPAGEAKQRRRRRRSKSPGNSKRPPEELKQHIEFDLVETEGMTSDQLRDIPYTKVETKASLFRVKYSPKFRQKIWASRRKSFGEADAHFESNHREASNGLPRQESYNTEPAGTYIGYNSQLGPDQDDSEYPSGYKTLPSVGRSQTRDHRIRDDFPGNSRLSGYDSHPNRMSSIHRHHQPNQGHAGNAPYLHETTGYFADTSDGETTVSFRQNPNVGLRKEASGILPDSENHFHQRSHSSRVPRSENGSSLYMGSHSKRQSGYESSPQLRYSSREECVTSPHSVSSHDRRQAANVYEQKEQSHLPYGATHSESLRQVSHHQMSKLKSPPSLNPTSSTNDPSKATAVLQEREILSNYSSTYSHNLHAHSNHQPSFTISHSGHTVHEDSKLLRQRKPVGSPEWQPDWHQKQPPAPSQATPPSTRTPQLDQYSSSNTFMNPVYFNSESATTDFTSANKDFSVSGYGNNNHPNNLNSASPVYNPLNRQGPGIPTPRHYSGPSVPREPQSYSARTPVNRALYDQESQQYYPTATSAFSARGQMNYGTSPQRSSNHEMSTSQMQTPPPNYADSMRNGPTGRDNSPVRASKPPFYNRSTPPRQNSQFPDHNSVALSPRALDFSTRTPPRYSAQPETNVAHFRGHSGQSASSSGYSGSHSRQSGTPTTNISPRHPGNPYNPVGAQVPDRQHTRTSQPQYNRMPPTPNNRQGSNFNADRQVGYQHPVSPRVSRPASFRSDLVTEL